jgi:TM2 domain.
MYRILFVCFAYVSCLSAQQQYQDVVYLKDGSIIHGIIIEQVPNVSLKIQTKDQNVFVYKMDDILKMTKEPIIETQQQNGGQQQNMGLSDFSNNRGYKSPGLAFLFSVIIPGAGQYYNGDIAKGVIQDVLFTSGIVFSSIGYDYSTEEIVYPISLGVMLGAYIWSIIDAPVSASIINSRNGRRISFDFGITPKGAGAKLSYNF